MTDPSATPLADQSKEVQLQTAHILFKLNQLGFTASFSHLEEGPILRSFFLKPSLEALYAKVLSKEEEIAGALRVESVRLFRSGGLLVCEVPRSDKKLIRFDQCLHEMLSRSDVRSTMALPLLMGQSPKGEYLFSDLAAQPHLMIAGATGSGKSIGLSQLICSMALFRNPVELELILVDTKNLDLVLFKSLAHVREVITAVPDLRTKLEDLLAEVRKRNSRMSGFARNIREYNALGFGKLSYKVLIIDELADVLETDAALRTSMDKTEKANTPSIASLLKLITQLSRASGIHIIFATQRPSAKMVTGDAKIGFGDLKANFLGRICFKLPTMADSRVVLDENGAESLLGRGDYLYKLSGLDTPQRAHSAFVSMDDIALILSQHDSIRNMYKERITA